MLTFFFISKAAQFYNPKFPKRRPLFLRLPGEWMKSHDEDEKLDFFGGDPTNQVVLCRYYFFW
jgi:hypothetical protein